MLRTDLARPASANVSAQCRPCGRYGTSRILPAAILLMSCLSQMAPGAEPTPPDGAVRYVIIVTGGELLTGVYPDGHTHFITRTLHPLGLQCVGSMCVDDKMADIQAALRFARDKGAFVIVTGGLGPTDNDITREALSQFTGIALKEHPDVLAAMAKRFNTTPEGLRANLRRQTQTPTRGTYLKNRNGTAIGLVFETADAVIIALPGPPRELQPMVHEELAPYLGRRFGTRKPGPSLTLRFIGLGQSQIDQRLKELVKLPPDVTTYSQFQGGRVDFTFSLPQDAPESRTRLDELRDAILKHMGEHIYGQGDTSLEQHVVDLLAARGQTLCLVEAGSGGDVVSALGTADGAARVVAGAWVAPTEGALCRLLGTSDAPSDDRLARLAVTAAGKTASPWVLATGEVPRDHHRTGGMQVVLRRPDGTIDTPRMPAPGTDRSARDNLTTQLLDRLRRSLDSKSARE